MSSYPIFWNTREITSVFPVVVCNEDLLSQVMISIMRSPASS